MFPTGHQFLDDTHAAQIMQDQQLVMKDIIAQLLLSAAALGGIAKCRRVKLAEGRHRPAHLLMPDEQSARGFRRVQDPAWDALPFSLLALQGRIFALDNHLLQKLNKSKTPQGTFSRFKGMREILLETNATGELVKLRWAPLDRKAMTGLKIAKSEDKGYVEALTRETELESRILSRETQYFRLHKLLLRRSTEKHYRTLPWFVGDNLHGTIRRAPFSAKDIVTILTDVIRTLSLFHKAGYAHLDIKLENIMVTREPDTHKAQGHLIDFGSARQLGTTGTRVTTASYLATEFCRAHYPGAQYEGWDNARIRGNKRYWADFDTRMTYTTRIDFYALGFLITEMAGRIARSQPVSTRKFSDLSTRLYNSNRAPITLDDVLSTLAEISPKAAPVTTQVASVMPFFPSKSSVTPDKESNIDTPTVRQTEDETGSSQTLSPHVGI